MELSDHDLLLRLDEKMDALLEWRMEHAKKHSEYDADIKKLQEWRWREAGALSVLVFVIDWVKGWFSGRTP